MEFELIGIMELNIRVLVKLLVAAKICFKVTSASALLWSLSPESQDQAPQFHVTEHSLLTAYVLVE